MEIDRRSFIANAASAGLLAALGRNLVQAEPAASSKGTKKVLLDTDIGSDIDDAVALSYLLAQPQCDLLGITTVTGEPVKRAEMASAMCRLAGRADIPIYPGAAQPLVMTQRQPLAPQHAALGAWSHESRFPTGEAVEFLRRTIRAHPGEITLLAVGPMTNLGLLFRVDPEIPRLLKELVLMCGKFGPEPARWGHTEWNAIVDPEATAIVFAGGAPVLRSYGLDVTMKLALPRDEVVRRFSAHAPLRQVLEFAQVWFAKQDEIVFHDPLAAVSVFAPDVCGLERGWATIDLRDGPEKGRTLWAADAAGRHDIGATVDVARFFAEYFGVFGRAAKVTG